MKDIWGKERPGNEKNCYEANMKKVETPLTRRPDLFVEPKPFKSAPNPGYPFRAHPQTCHGFHSDQISGAGRPLNQETDVQDLCTVLFRQVGQRRGNPFRSISWGKA